MALSAAVDTTNRRDREVAMGTLGHVLATAPARPYVIATEAKGIARQQNDKNQAIARHDAMASRSARCT